MKREAPSIVFGIALALLAPAAQAASSDWFETEGGRVRLVTSGTPDATGRLKGVLDIDLRPGWKTYWRDPGDAGVPPTIDVSRSTNISTAELDFPAPGRHVESEFTWAGYDRSVALPLTFQADKPGDPVTIEGDVFLGICETICIPVKAELTVDPASDPDNSDDAAIVEAAFVALPTPARADFGVMFVSYGASALILEAHIPGDATGADLFITGADDGYTLGTPKRLDKDGKVLFAIEASGPARVEPAARLIYTLVTAKGSVSGTLPGF